eukprot:765655-Amphidinium_carterae.5
MELVETYRMGNRLEIFQRQLRVIARSQDVGPGGFRLSAAALKCERSRTATLMRCAQYDLSVLKVACPAHSMRVSGSLFHFCRGSSQVCSGITHPRCINTYYCT